MSRALLALVVLALFSTAVPAATVYVPSEQPTIQAGINAAGDGGTVYVAPGVYAGEGNREIDFGGMNVTLESTGGLASTVVDCGGTARGFYFHTGEDATSVIEGFTIRNCDGDYGGAVRCQGASPTIRYCMFSSNSVSSGGGALHVDSTSNPTVEFCIFTSNSAQFGGAIYMDGAGGWIRNCSFTGNSADGWGGAVFLRAIAGTTFEDCTFAENTSTQYGGAVHSIDAESTFERCTFVGNEASYGGGVYLQSDDNPPRFTRCTFVDNQGGGIRTTGASPVVAQSIFAFDRTHAGILCTGVGEPSITHSFFFGNGPAPLRHAVRRRPALRQLTVPARPEPVGRARGCEARGMPRLRIACRLRKLGYHQGAIPEAGLTFSDALGPYMRRGASFSGESGDSACPSREGRPSSLTNVV